MLGANPVVPFPLPRPHQLVSLRHLCRLSPTRGLITSRWAPEPTAVLPAAVATGHTWLLTT